MLPLIQNRKERKNLDKLIEQYENDKKQILENARSNPKKQLIHPQHLARIVDKYAQANAIFTCDVGTPTVWAARYIQMNGQRRLLGSFCHGSMASAFPQAIGAQLAFPERQIISLSGDGGFAMLMGDILTLQQYHLPIKIIIFNNSAFGFVELEMHAAGFLDYGTHLDNPNFAKLAESIGIKGIRIEDPNELERSIQEGLAIEGPALIDVVVNRLEVPLPPHIEANQALGFSLFAIKAVLNGQGDELIDLTSSNLFR